MIPTTVHLLNLPALAPKVQFTMRYRNLTIELDNWRISDSQPPRWCSYLYLYERWIPKAVFESIWLPHRVVKMAPESYGFVTYDYEGSPLGAIEMHGGITYYRKHGEVEGHRCVQIGCDYNHLWDQDIDYQIEEVAHEAVESADLAVERLGISQEGVKTDCGD